MKTKMLKNWILISVVLMGLMPTVQATASGQIQNAVAVVIDSSGSYRDKFQSAIDRATVLLEEMSETELHRWDKDTDVITLITLDAIPEVIWEGSLQELRALDASYWQHRFTSRSDYMYCTDVGRAFHLAVKSVEGDASLATKYIFIFSDAIHEPPKDSIRRCIPPTFPSPPPNDMPWEALADCSVHMFWMPPEQKLFWHRFIIQKGLEENFSFYTPSEMNSIIISAPPRPIRSLSDEEKKAIRHKVANAGKTVAKIGLLTLLGVLGLGFLLSIMVRLASRKEQRPGKRRSGGNYKRSTVSYPRKRARVSKKPIRRKS